MPQFFHPRWNLLARLGLYGLPLVLAAVGGAAYWWVRSPVETGVGVPVAQPMPFPHDVHAGRLGIDCRYCHATAETEAFAGMPSTETCMHCHAHVWTALPALEPVRASYRTGLPLAWVRVHDLPDYAQFHHGIHTHKGVGCASCHGRVDRMAAVAKAETLHMEWCLECHRNPGRYVRPREEVFNMAWEPPADRAALGAELVERYGIRQQTSCSICHH